MDEKTKPLFTLNFARAKARGTLFPYASFMDEKTKPLFTLNFARAKARGTLFPYAVEAGWMSPSREITITRWLTDYFGSPDFGNPDRRWYRKHEFFAFRYEADMVLFVTAWQGESADV